MNSKMEVAKKIKGRDAHLGIIGWFYAGRYWLERYAYIVHRITGLAMILYLVLHIFVVGERAKGQEAWNAMMSKIQSPLFEFLEFLLLVAFIVHALNGLRLILIELGFFVGKPSRPKYPYRTSISKQRPLVYLIMLVGAFFIVVSIYEFFKLGGGQ